MSNTSPESGETLSRRELQNTTGAVLAGAVSLAAADVLAEHGEQIVENFTSKVHQNDSRIGHSLLNDHPRLQWGFGRPSDVTSLLASFAYAHHEPNDLLVATLDSLTVTDPSDHVDGSNILIDETTEAELHILRGIPDSEGDVGRYVTRTNREGLMTNFVGSTFVASMIFNLEGNTDPNIADFNELMAHDWFSGPRGVMAGFSATANGFWSETLSAPAFTDAPYGSLGDRSRESTMSVATKTIVDRINDLKEGYVPGASDIALEGVFDERSEGGYVVSERVREVMNAFLAEANTHPAGPMSSATCPANKVRPNLTPGTEAYQRAVGYLGQLGQSRYIRPDGRIDFGRGIFRLTNDVFRENVDKLKATGAQDLIVPSP